MGNNQKLSIYLKILLAFLVFLWLMPAAVHPARAQEEATSAPEEETAGPEDATGTPEEERIWAVPTNLSMSGSTSAPVMVFDSDGVVHVVWRDDFDGPVYTRLEDGKWSTPKIVDVPWAPPANVNASQAIDRYIPTLMADTSNRIHAFWIGDEGSLYYSYAPSRSFADDGWVTAQLVSASVIGFNAALGPNNEIHVSYVRTLNTEEAPAGLYYRFRGRNSTAFRSPDLLYESGYFREIEPEEIYIQTLVLATEVEGETNQNLFVSWDLRPRRELFMLHSGDGGDNWDDVIKVASPENNMDMVTPNGVGMAPSNDGLMLVWKEMEMEIPTNCTQFSQLYSLTGEALSAPTEMLKDIPGCPLENQSLLNVGGSLILQTSIFNTYYLLAWDGQRWSLPQPQLELSNLIDSGTFQPVRLKCVQVIFDGEDELLMIGCDSGAGGDIWFTHRDQKEVTGWFSQTSTWGTPSALISTAGEIASIAIVPDRSNLLHAVWAQSETFGGEESIYYARWDGTDWTHILPILSVPFGTVNQLTTAIGPSGKIHMVWSGGETGEIYFSWAKADLAGNLSEWTTPIELPMPRKVGSHPTLSVSDDGTIFVAYAIPFNERRGVYLTKSVDGGNSWSDPETVFDAAGAGWEMVDLPDIGSSTDGQLQILFTRFPPPNSILPKSLYYSLSDDDGETWSEAEEVANGDVFWSATGGLEGGHSYRLWVQKQSNSIATNLEASMDAQTWSSPINFSSFESSHALSSLAMEDNIQLHLIQIFERQTEAFALSPSLALQEWVWSGSSWENGERIRLGDGRFAGNESLGAAISSGGNLAVLFTRYLGESPIEGMELVFLGRKIDFSPITAARETPAEVVPETPEPTQTPAPDDEATPTPTQSGAVSDRPVVSSPQNQDRNMIFGVIAGFLSAGLIVVGTVIVFSRFTRHQ